MTKRTPPYSPEVRARAVRMVLEHQEEHGTQWASIQSIAAKIGCSGETLRNWVCQAGRDEGVRPGATSAEEEELAKLRREVRELRQANEILRKGEPLTRHWSERQWRTRILRWRSSTAGASHEGVHRRASR